jgi:hypothetical protein
MSFNFGLSAESAVRSTIRPLAPWEIHDVEFKGAEIRKFQGKKDPNAVYELLTIKYENEDGYFNVDLFFPKDGDDVRPEFDGQNGGKVHMASSFENTMAIIKQTVQILNPKGFDTLQKASVKCTSFEQLAGMVVKVLTPVIGKKIKIKLTGRNRDGKVVAQIPRILALNKEEEAFICDNYIGEKLFWSDYETTKRDEFLKAKPTDPEKAGEDTVGVDEAPKDDLDLDSLL